jgi:tRNA1Val (adenine37-N6)-methyltransferase
MVHDLFPDDWIQPEEGYRFSVDSILLASFAPFSLPGGKAADFGAGCGVVALEALVQGRLAGVKSLVFVEVMEYFRPSLEKNLKRAKKLLPNPPEFKIFWKDWRNISLEDLGGPLDYLTVNPPYRKPDSGKEPKGTLKVARTEIMGGIIDLLQKGKSLLNPGGILTLSWPRARLPELLRTAEGLGLTLSYLEFPPRSKSKLVLAKLANGQARQRKRP